MVTAPLAVGSSVVGLALTGSSTAHAANGAVCIDLVGNATSSPSDVVGTGPCSTTPGKGQDGSSDLVPLASVDVCAGSGGTGTGGDPGAITVASTGNADIWADLLAGPTGALELSPNGSTWVGIASQQQGC